MSKVLAFDFGASTGRALIGTVHNGILEYTEINRFDNVPYSKDGHMYWDFTTLWNNIKYSIKLAGDIDSIGIDTWGVDYGLVAPNGKLVHDPYHYRDSRSEKVFGELMAKYGDTLYERTGIQVMNINTMFQFVSEMRESDIEDGTKALFIPDLFAYMLTGKMYSEYTIATTSGLVDSRTHDWNLQLIDELGLKRDMFAPILPNGNEYGLIRKELAEELGVRDDIKVIAVCTHDTASAIMSMVTNPDDSIYISSGTWSLIGIERDSIDVSNRLFTNEGGYNGSITYLSNVMGLWLIQEFRRELTRERGYKVTFPELEAMMEGVEGHKYIVNTNDESFVAPKSMRQAIEDYIVNTNQGENLTDGEIVRCIYDSLANAYNDRVKLLNAMFSNKFTTINILGGGSQAVPLIERTQELTGLKVVAGPVEATAIGNILVQLIHLGDIKSIDDARSLVARSENVRVYES